MLNLRSDQVGFKEWSLVCDALGQGRQSLILRKGGIAEGKGGFQWQAQDFWLFPTHFHEQAERITWTPTSEALADLASPDIIRVRYAARLLAHTVVTDWGVARALAPYHVWREEIVHERFGYGETLGLSVALVEVWKLSTAWELAPSPRFGGCRSWLDLPADEGVAARDRASPVLSAEHSAAVQAELGALLPWTWINHVKVD